MDNNELALWIAKRKIDPKEDGYLQSAVIIRYLCSINGCKKLPALHDIWKHLKPPVVNQEVELAKWWVATQIHNGKVARGEI